MRRSRLIARATVVGMAVTALASASIVAAGAYPADCASTHVCVYDNANFGSQLGWRVQQFALQDVSTGNNDKMSSWSNHSVYNACWYSDISGGGTSHQMNQYSSNSYVGLWDNDSMSSWKGASC